KSVHSHTANERRALAVNERETLVADARETVAVTQRQHCDAARRRGGVSHPITNSVSRLQLLNRGETRLYRHNRLNPVNSPAGLRREDAQRQDAEPDHVEMGLGQIQEATTVAEMPDFRPDASLTHGLQRFVVSCELQIGKSLVGFIRLRKV